MNQYQRSRISSHQSKKFTEKRKYRKAFAVAMGVMIAITWTFSLSRLTKLSAFNIDTISVIGADSDITPQLQAAALNALNGNYFGIFDKDSIVMFPKTAVISAVASSSSRIASVTVSRDGLNALKVTVTEKDPSAVVCDSLPDFNGNSISVSDTDDCYLVDDAGILFRKAPSFSNGVYNRYYDPYLAGTGTTTSTIVGTYATSTTEFHALQDLYDNAKKSGISVDAILFKDNGEYEMYARNPTSVNETTSSGTETASSTDQTGTIVIYFNNQRPFQSQLDNLVSFWNKDVTDKSTSNSSANYDYIDVRFGSNVFYRKMK